MDVDRINAVIKYALATARLVHDEDWKLQDLGPIHLLKYTYLADLAFAEEAGQTFTGTDWVFHDFGPWSLELFEHLDDATKDLRIERREISSDHLARDFVRWKVPRREDAEKLRDAVERTLPASVRGALKAAVREFGNATHDLLHHVYRTSPMLVAAPEERLDFAQAKRERIPEESTPTEPVRKKAIQKREEALTSARARFQTAVQARLQKRQSAAAQNRESVHDADLLELLRQLDEGEGASPNGVGGQLAFGDAIWKSSVRKVGDE